MYQQVLDPVAGSLAASSALAALPLIVLFVLLGLFRVTAWKASLLALLTALLVAVLVYPMPLDQALLAGSLGAVFGFFPILWIVINAIWIYNMTVTTGYFEPLQRSFERVSVDRRIQAMIIAFCFGALLEALAGFGTPVAITSVMLLGLGIRPLMAAAVALIANTAPVAFGALAAPIVTLAEVSGLPQDQLGAMVGRQTPVLAVVVPMVLVGVMGGWRGVRETLPATLTCGISFALAQFIASNYISVPLADIVASLVSAAAVVALMRVWSPRNPDRSGESDAPQAAAPPADGRSERSRTVRAYAPYVIIIAVFVLAQLPGISGLLEAATLEFQWPGLELLDPQGQPQGIAGFTLNFLSAAGSLLLISGLLSMPVLGAHPVAALRSYGATYVQLRWAIVTVMAVLAIAFVMNASGQTTTLGLWMAGAGGLFALLSPILGWLGVAVTGSDTSSNSLFGALQVTAANQTGLNPLLAAAGNSSGGVLGKMISPQNLAIAASAVGMAGREGEIFRRVLGWSVIFLALMCALVYLQSTPVLGWMVPA